MKVVENIQTVTRTLATVSSAKLSRTRRRAAGMREYAQAMRETLERQQHQMTHDPQVAAQAVAFLRERDEVRAVTVLHITGDRGMCGNYNQIANRVTLEFIERRQQAGQAVSVIAKGAKGERFCARKTRASIVHAETWSRTGVSEEDINRLCDMVTGRFLSGEADEVWCLYTRFHSPLKRTPRLVRLLPVAPERLTSLRREGPEERWEYEPSFSDVVEELITTFVRIQVEDVLLESYASEQGARMVTMEEATERADKSLHEMKMRYNRLRREAITTDLIGVLFASQVRADEEQHAVTEVE